MKLFIIFAFILILSGCNSKPEEKPSKPSEIIKKPVLELTGADYFFAPQFDAEKCEGIAECDCCSWNVLFINDKNFITICPCESDESVFTGTYKILKDKVILDYDLREVDRNYNWEAETDTTGTVKPEYDIVVTSRQATTEVLNAKYCGGKLYFTTSVGNEVSYGVTDNRYSLQQHIQILREEGIWNKLHK